MFFFLNSQQEVEAALDQVCSLLPVTIRSQCDQFVAQYTDLLIQLLVHVDPQQVCTFLGVCSAKQITGKIVL